MQEVVATHLVQLFLCKAKHEYCITVHLYYHFQSQFGRTALQLAAQKGNNSMFEFLLLHGANIHHCTLVSQGIIYTYLELRHDIVNLCMHRLAASQMK